MRFDTLSVPLAETKAAAKRGGGKINDAFVTAVARGLRYYHDKHGAAPERLRMGMPINVRTAETADLAGNQWAPTRFPLPIGWTIPSSTSRSSGASSPCSAASRPWDWWSRCPRSSTACPPPCWPASSARC